MKSITYWHPFIYSHLIKLSYGKYFINRYKVLSELVESKSSVLDMCCGDCKMYDFLKMKDVNYIGIDFNNTFIKSARSKGIKAYQLDVSSDDIPKADIVLLQASLYQFFPNHQHLLKKLLDAATKYVILSEPVRNFGDSRFKMISWIGCMLNNPGNGTKSFRFNMATLKEALKPFQKNIVKEFLASGEMEYIVVLQKNISQS